MASASRGSDTTRRIGRPARGWVRKNLHIDQRKLDAARKALGVKAETVRRRSEKTRNPKPA